MHVSLNDECSNVPYAGAVLSGRILPNGDFLKVATLERSDKADNNRNLLVKVFYSENGAQTSLT